MLVRAKETILKDGSLICDIEIAKNPEESTGEWLDRRESLINAIANLAFLHMSDSGMTIRLHMIPSGEMGVEFNPAKLSESDLLRELGDVGTQGVKTSVKYEEG